MIGIRLAMLVACFVISSNACPCISASDDTTAGNKTVAVRKGDFLRTGEPLYTCGIYSLYGALSALEIDARLDSMLDQKNMEWIHGSSAQQLVNLAEENGAYAYPYSGLGVSWLRSADKPVILHLSRSRRGNQTKHWVLFLGDKDGQARIYDAPRPVELVDYADLLSTWDGVAIIVSDTPRSSISGWLSSRYDLLLWMVIPLALVVIVKTYSGKRFPVAQRVSKGGLNSAFFQVAGLVLLATVWVTAFHYVSPIGFAGNERALSTVCRPFFAPEEFEDLNFQELKEEINWNSTLVDARTPIGFGYGSIPGAISIPVDASHQEFDAAIKELDPNRTTIVFCSHQYCGWSKVVATDLKLAGFTNLKIYSGGMREWRQRQLDSQ